jgi:hypothetical protein
MQKLFVLLGVEYHLMYSLRKFSANLDFDMAKSQFLVILLNKGSF